MSTLVLNQVQKQFAGQNALNGVDLSLEANARLMMLGRSGAGKTTLLRIIAGLEQLDSGAVFIDDRDVTKIAPSRRGVAMVSQDYALYPQLSVMRNLEVALHPQRLSRDQRQQRIANVLDCFGITGLTDRLPSQLSGGEAQRVAIAKALVRQPKMLLLDEPLSQIDSQLREQLSQMIETISQMHPVTIVMVTHDPVSALRLGTKLGILESGRILQFGDPQEVYDGPKTQLVAELTSALGMNWLEVQEGASADASAAFCIVGERPIGKRQVGFRPEHVNMVSGGERMPDGAGLSFRGSLVHAQPLGHGFLAQCMLLDRMHTPLRVLVRGPLDNMRVVEHDFHVARADLIWI